MPQAASRDRSYGTAGVREDGAAGARQDGGGGRRAAVTRRLTAEKVVELCLHPVSTEGVGGGAVLG